SRSHISAHWSVSVLGDSSKSTSAEKRIRAGIGHVRPHDLRHTCASLLIAEGLNIKQVSSHLRHSSVGVTLDTYGHLYPGDRNEVAHAMDRVLGIAKNG
ncbi:MAG: tyrosine-type recombinase/integrase, partial [Candidatus Latescibacteria bacterium]|nr:tyrosine-type recombinase/integrase [Candidatus Latescibacterota bacterium]